MSTVFNEILPNEYPQITSLRFTLNDFKQRGINKNSRHNFAVH